MEFCVGTFNSPFASSAGSSIHWRWSFKRYMGRIVLTRGNRNGIICSFKKRGKRHFEILF